MFITSSLGWVWDSDSTWSVEKALTDIDADGWSYSVDFGHFTNDNVPDAMMTCGGSAIKGAMHFVRRRKLGRIQSFDGFLLFYFFTQLYHCYSF